MKKELGKITKIKYRKPYEINLDVDVISFKVVYELHINGVKLRMKKKTK